MNISAWISHQLTRAYNKLESLIIKYPRGYLSFITIIALTGYLMALIFPALSITGSYYVYQQLTGIQADWQGAAIWAGVVILSGVLSFRIISMKVSTPAGLRVSKDKLPEIYELVAKIQQKFKRPRLKNIVISSDYELTVVKTPKWAIPLWSENTLVIGLPVLICLSPAQFECLLASRLGQFSKHHNPVTNWLYQLRDIWPQYASSFGKTNKIDTLFLKLIYSGYARLYSALSFYVARYDRLNADSYAMELYNHEVVCEMITIDTLYQHYMDNTFMPAIKKLAEEGKNNIRPNQKLSAIVSGQLKQAKTQSLINQLFSPEFKSRGSAPVPLERLKNIAHDKPAILKPAKQNAAITYLGTSANIVTDIIDKLWLKKTVKTQLKSARRPGINPFYFFAKYRQMRSS